MPYITPNGECVQWTYDEVESALKKLRFVHKWGDVHTPLVLTKLSRFGQFISAVKFQYTDAYVHVPPCVRRCMVRLAMEHEGA